MNLVIWFWSAVTQEDDEELKNFFCPARNSDRIRVTEENEVIYRDLSLPIPSDPSLKVDVSRTNLLQFVSAVVFHIVLSYLHLTYQKKS